MENRLCGVCGKAFSPVTPNGKYCSSPCRREAHRRGNRRKNRRVRQMMAEASKRKVIKLPAAVTGICRRCKVLGELGDGYCVRCWDRKVG